MTRYEGDMTTSVSSAAYDLTFRMANYMMITEMSLPETTYPIPAPHVIVKCDCGATADVYFDFDTEYLKIKPALLETTCAGCGRLDWVLIVPPGMITPVTLDPKGGTR